MTLSESEPGTVTEGERGKKEKEIGIAIRTEKIEIGGRTESVTGVVGTGKENEIEKGIVWIERGTSEDAIRRKILRALETVAQAVVGQCKGLMI